MPKHLPFFLSSSSSSPLLPRRQCVPLRLTNWRGGGVERLLLRSPRRRARARVHKLTISMSRARKVSVGPAALGYLQYVYRYYLTYQVI